MNTGKRKFASNLMAIIWFIIYLMPVMTFGFYSLGNIGADKVYKDDIFPSAAPVLTMLETGSDISDPLLSFNEVFFVDYQNISLTQFSSTSFGSLLLYLTEYFEGVLPGEFYFYPYLTIDDLNYYLVLSFAEDTDSVVYTLSFSTLTSIVTDYEHSLFPRVVSSIDVNSFNVSTVSFYNSPVYYSAGTCSYVYSNLLFYNVPVITPSFMDKTFAQFGYDSNNLDIVGQSIVDFGELVNFNGLTATSPATFFIWWFFLVTIVRLLFEIVAFIPKIAVKWLHYFSRE